MWCQTTSPSLRTSTTVASPSRPVSCGCPAGRIERRAVECDAAASGVDVDNRCREVAQVGIAQVEQFAVRHAPILPGPGRHRPSGAWPYTRADDADRSFDSPCRAHRDPRRRDARRLLERWLEQQHHDARYPRQRWPTPRSPAAHRPGSTGDCRSERCCPVPVQVRRWAKASSTPFISPSTRSTRRGASCSGTSSSPRPTRAATPKHALRSLEILLDGDVDVVVGPASSRVALGVLSEMIEAGLTVCSPTNTSISLRRFPDQNLYFRTIPSDALQAIAMAAGDRTYGRQRCLHPLHRRRVRARLLDCARERPKPVASASWRKSLSTRPADDLETDGATAGPRPAPPRSPSSAIRSTACRCCRPRRGSTRAACCTSSTAPAAPAEPGSVARRLRRRRSWTACGALRRRPRPRRRPSTPRLPSGTPAHRPRLRGIRLRLHDPPTRWQRRRPVATTPPRSPASWTV